MENKKIHVLFPRIETFHYHQAYDGGSKYIQYLSEFLVKQGINVTIVTTQLRKNLLLRESNHNGVKYVFISPKYTGKRLIPFNVFYKFIFSKNLKKYLQKIHFDIIHNTESFAYFYLRNRKRKPVITQTFGLEPFYGPESLSQKGIKKIYVKLFLQHPWLYCLKKSDKIASEGKFQNKLIEKLGIKKEKIFPLPNAVNLKKIREMERNKKDIRKKLKIKKSDLLILSVCQISPDKGIDDIINSFSLVKKKISNARLIIIGKGKLESMMKNLIKKNNLIEERDVFHRKDVVEKELYNYYFSSDIFVTGSTQSDLVLCVQEAMACGLPIVGANQEMLIKNGKNGYVVGSNNPRGIANAILKIYSEGKKEMNRMGKESKIIAKEYDYEKIFCDVIKTYKKF